ncbi:MAG: hypothetical protein ABSA65_11705 [Acidimicrobiales bacterium]|jgi:hypothetical protein
MRYRRYYSHGNPDGSTTVTSYGPITTGASIAWKSAFGTALIFFIAFCLLNPWSPGSTAGTLWAVAWGGVGFTLHVCHQVPPKRSKRPQSAGQSSHTDSPV